MSKRLLETMLITLGFFVYLFLFSNNTHAAISYCTADSTPGSAQPNTTDNRVDFTIWNYDGANSVSWFKITRPFSGITIKSSALFQWSRTASEDNVVFTGNSIGPYGSVAPYVTLDTDNAGGSGNWVVEASDDPGGANPTTCVGTLSYQVDAGGLDQTAPVISNVSSSGVTTSQVTISWSTDEATTSHLEFGIESGSYPFTRDGASYVTSHSFTLTELGSGTTYYYYICSTDEAGNQACTDDEYTFTTVSTAVATATPTTAPIYITPTPTPTGAPTATPTPIPQDKTKPKTKISTELEESYEDAPLIEGSATDNKTISSVSYSTDGGDNWLPVDDVEGLGTGSVAFSFTPYVFEDANYEIVARAIDNSDNAGLSDTITLVIDKLPPRIGGNLISLGPQPLLPNEQGVLISMAGLDQKITLSAVGGPTSIDLIINDQTFSLQSSDETGLWSGYLNLPDPGLYQIKTKAVDGAGNITERTLNSILVVGPGKILDAESGKTVKKGEVSLYIQDPASKIWALWDGKTFSQTNPQKLTDEGTYQYFLPPGKYYIQIKSPGYSTLTSQIFNLNSSTAFNADFEMKESSGVKIGPFTFSLFNYLTEKAKVSIKSPVVEFNSNRIPLIGQNASDFDLFSTSGNSFELKDLQGDTSVISFVSTWSPPSVEQVSILDELIQKELVPSVVIATQETGSKVAIFQRRGNYKSEMVVDPDGDLVEDYRISSLPAHFFLDRSGSIKRIIYGVLNKEEFENIITEIR